MDADVGIISRARGRAAIAVPRFVAWGAWGLMLALVIGSGLVWLMDGQKALPISFAHGALGVVSVATCAVVFTTLGTILGSRMSSSPIGWLLLAIGMLFAFLTPVDLVIQGAFEVARPFPATTLFAAWFMSSAMTPTIVGCILMVCLVFPDGRFPAGRWWMCGALGVAGSLLLAISSALEPTGLIWYPTLPNPVALPAAYGPVVLAVRMIALAAILSAGSIAAACVAVRYRRADLRVRQQLRWILVGVGAMTAGLLPFLVARYALQLGDDAGEILIAFAAAAVCMFPISVALAVVRQHLFDIDRVISRTLVYVPLMGILAGVYTASLTLFQRVFVSLTEDSSDAAIVLSALILASVFAPIRSALEAQVGRHFNPPRPPVQEPPADGATRVAPSLGEPIAAVAATRPAGLLKMSTPPRPTAGEVDLAARVAELETALDDLRRRDEDGSRAAAGARADRGERRADGPPPDRLTS